MFYEYPSAMWTAKDRLFLTKDELLEVMKDDIFIKSLIYHVDQYSELFLPALSQGLNIAIDDSERLAFGWLQNEFYQTQIETRWCLPISFEDGV